MTVFDWMESVVFESYRLLSNPWYSISMGALSILIASVALAFNHYNWKRAHILTAMTTVYTVGWYIIKLLLMESEAVRGLSFTNTVYTILLSVFLVAGFYLAGFISSLKENPILKFKLYLILYLRKWSDQIEKTLQTDKAIINEKKQEAAIEYVKQVITENAK